MKNSIYTFENGEKEHSFFCMNLVKFLSVEKEKEQLSYEQFSKLWRVRFDAARNGACHYREECSIYKRTLKAGVRQTMK